MHHYQDIQSLDWMKDKANKRIEYLPRRQGLVIYFDVSNRKPAFLNSFIFYVQMNLIVLRTCLLNF